MSNILKSNSIPSADGLAQNPLLGAGMGGLVVLSLFDGMSCGRLALQKAGIKVKQYYASEIDKYAIQVTQKNFPDTIQLGDVTKVFAKDLPNIDLIIGGSPCQGFSFAGKGLNFEDPRSKLFFEFVRLVNECKPKYFLLENVKMKKEHELVISQYMKVAPIEINSALVSAQNRVRLYWTNIAQKPYGFFGDMFTDIPQPKDKGIKLKDVLENDIDEKYYLSDKLIKYITNKKRLEKKFTAIDGDKSLSMMANYFNSTNGSFCIDCNGRIDDNKTGTITSTYHKGTETNGSRPFIKEKSGCFTAGGNSGGKHSDMDLIPHNERIRRLVPVEVERLQTVPDGYTSSVSDTQRYRMLGNGWTVDVIAYIFGFMKSELSNVQGGNACT
jgi:DNA-cytosine methyltransferase